MNQDEQTMTDRIIAAMHNPYVDIVVYPTGRVSGRRDPYAVDIERVIAAARDTGTCLEINASPERLDLERRACSRGQDGRVARRQHRCAQGSKVRTDEFSASLSPAAAWVEKQHVLNCLPLDELLRTLKRSRA